MAWACVTALLLLWGSLTQAHADTVIPDISSMQLTRTDEGLFLSANLQFELPGQVEDALRQGIPMYFVADAQVQRERWYWSDQQLGVATRYFRLTHQTMKLLWRVHMSN